MWDLLLGSLVSRTSQKVTAQLTAATPSSDLDPKRSSPHSAVASAMASAGRSPPLRPLVFAFYLTGHGFGHATRAIEVSQSVPSRIPLPPAHSGLVRFFAI